MVSGAPSASSASSPDTATLLKAVTEAQSASGLLGATSALAGHLAACETPSPEAIALLVQVLGYNNPGAAVAAVDGLVACGEAAVEPLLANLDAHNYGARAWAVRALAGIGDVRGLELLEQALGDDIGPSVRRAAARGLGQLRWADLDSKQRQRIHARALRALQAATADGEWVVRYAVVVGLEGLGASLPAGAADRDSVLRLLHGLSEAAEPTTVVRLRAAQAMGRLAT